VGTSVCATLLALAAAAQGARTLLVDGDEHVGPLRYLLGVPPSHAVADLRAGLDAAALVVPLGDALGFVPGGPGASGDAALPVAERRALLRRVAALFDAWDFVVVDAGSRFEGVSAWCSDPHTARLVAVMGVDAVSLAATYALVKAVRQRTPALPADVLVSRHDDAAAARAFAQVESGVRQFALGEVRFAGTIPDDATLETALRGGMPLADAATGSAAAHAAHALAARLAAPHAPALR
jgi:MinD-like ATPase involved in chromosome partitioning or flagellar assembly